MKGPRNTSDGWHGDGYFRCLGYTFRLRWDSESAGQDLLRVLGQFQISAGQVPTRVPPTPNVPPVYALTHEADYWRVMYGTDVLFGGEPYDEAFCHLLWHINAEMGRLTGSYLLIHAGAVATPSGEAIVLPGDSGSGKTTLVAGLVERGYEYLSDEAAAIDPVSRLLYPYPRSLTLKRGSFPLFSHLDVAAPQAVLKLEDQWVVPPTALGKVADGPRPVRWIVSTLYERDSSTNLDQITPGAAVLELCRRATNLAHYGGRALPLLAEVAQGAEGYRLLTGDLTQALVALDRLTGS